MKVHETIDTLPKEKLALSIGFFDGVHRGHQALLKKLQSYHRQSCIVTFKEHPLQTLRPPAPTLITPLPVKLRLLQELGLDHVVVLDFSSVMNLSYDAFLSLFPISHFLRGKGSIFGKNKEGTEENVRAWGKKNNVLVEYMSLVDEVSSTKIREAIKAQDYFTAEKLLGHNHYE